jgi:hypothetical protein
MVQTKSKELAAARKVVPSTPWSAKRFCELTTSPTVCT